MEFKSLLILILYQKFFVVLEIKINNDIIVSEIINQH